MTFSYSVTYSISEDCLPPRVGAEGIENLRVDVKRQLRPQEVAKLFGTC